MENTESISVGIDVGSTTIKCVVCENDKIIYQSYEKHYSKIKESVYNMLNLLQKYIGGKKVSIAFTGSGSIGLSTRVGFDFVQEVYATCETVKKFETGVKTVIELGGEDAKIIFFNGNNIDERMNGTCAGGTGAFIEQMATLMNISVSEMDELSLNHKQIYPIASRCGVFAKTDIQPLLNQGANFSDIAQSIYQAVANQTITGLASGQPIQNKILFLGGPLTYCKGLRNAFITLLNLKDGDYSLPEYSRVAAAYGAMLFAKRAVKPLDYSEILDKAQKLLTLEIKKCELKPLFNNVAEYDAFVKLHKTASVKADNIKDYKGKAFLGVDCGSTTTKIVLLGENAELLYSFYDSNKGNPVQIVKDELSQIYKLIGNRIKIYGSVVTGYGEELIKNAFNFDEGVVETFAHFEAARFFSPNVDFIMDIGGQDIKCFRIRGGAIDNIILNEACSSGCGSFIETFAKSMGYNVEEFAKLGLFGDNPCNLGSRCTVFMNSLVKQAQRDNASIENISAGLSISVIKNVLYKVLRISDASELGKNIVVQGGTFLNDAVLRAFEQGIGRTVVRPELAGLMGAFGCALHARALKLENSVILTSEQLSEFVHTSHTAQCNSCGNRCKLTINQFGNKQRYVSGNQCEKGSGKLDNALKLPNLYQYKRDKINNLSHNIGGKRGKMGLPLCLGNYDLIAFWNEFFTSLDFETMITGQSNKELYLKGIKTIPSDTVCYDAKLMHGHIETLIENGADYIFYPSLTYNIDEKRGDNHYNCPVVAYYSETLKSSIPNFGKTKFFYPYININSSKQLSNELNKYFNNDFHFSKKEIKIAVKKAFKTLNVWYNDIKTEGLKAIEKAAADGRQILILTGRPYHIDKEVCHNIDKLANNLGFVVLSEDAVPLQGTKPEVSVLNQWTYHARMYNAAEYAAKNDKTQIVQLVSFGCGIDAITTDEIRRILEKRKKIYTQIKIDETTNLGAIKIRLRSLMCAIGEKEK